MRLTNSFWNLWQDFKKVLGPIERLNPNVKIVIKGMDDNYGRKQRAAR